MLTVYHCNGRSLARVEDITEASIKNAAWIDLVNPTEEEEDHVEALLNIDAPTREEMQEIEISNRLYAENGTLYMTATVIARLGSDAPLASPVTFILSGETLVTLRYIEPRSFATFISRAKRMNSGYSSGPLIMVGLFEAMINRQADVLEQAAVDIDALSAEVFDHDPATDQRHDFQDILQRLGHTGILSSKIRESLVSLARVIHFAIEAIDFSALGNGRELNNRLKALDKDIISLLDHVSYHASKINFLLDAVLGVISIEQNNMFKIFSMVTVTLMPPTLIGAIYGMNFKVMPELDQIWGYPLALSLMLASAIIPLVLFRRRGWF